MGLKDLIDSIKEEWPVVQQAPRTILLSVMILTAIVSLVEYGIFKETLNRKSDLIDTLTKQLAAKPTQISTTSGIATSPAETGDAIVSGNGNIANTGNSATINNVPVSPKHIQGSTQH